MSPTSYEGFELGDGVAVIVTVGAGDGVAVIVTVGAGDGVAVIVTVGAGDGVAVIVTVGAGDGVELGLILTPLLHTSFLPDLIHLNCSELAICICPSFVQLDPTFGLAIAG